VGESITRQTGARQGSRPTDDAAAPTLIVVLLRFGRVCVLISCQHIIAQDCQVGDCNGCPYKTFDAAALRRTLEARHGPIAALDAIEADARQGLHQAACARELALNLERAGALPGAVAALLPTAAMPSPDYYFKVWRSLVGVGDRTASQATQSESGFTPAM